MKKKRVVVFGIFDGIHEGHRFLFAQARKHGDELIVIVGRDEFMRSFKRKEPKYSEQERIEKLLKEPLIDDAVLGDKDLSLYGVLERVQPDVICFGYDQEVLEKDLKQWFKERGMDIPTYRLSKKTGG